MKLQTQYKEMHPRGPVKKTPSSLHWVDGFGAHDAKPNLNVRNNSADPLQYEVSASAASMVAGQPGLALNKAETCAVLQRRYTGERHVPSALNANRHWQN
jgi:hypothetical protein